MDALTQGLLGGAAAQLTMQKRLGKKALVAGVLGGMAADLDVLIYSPNNPMLGVTFHRHFTHSLIFIPLGALIVALFLRLFKSYRQDWKAVYWACFWGYATHALLDACTSYGTLLLWPFSSQRISWDCVAIIDPLFSIPLAIGIFFTQRSGRRVWVGAALLFCLLYLGLGEWQNRRGELWQKSIAQGRAHIATRSRVMPTLGNNLVWRSLYEADGKFWADTLYLPLWKEGHYEAGTSIPRFDSTQLPPGFLENPRWKTDWEKFLWFTEGFVAESNGVLADMRYSSESGAFQPLWGILLPKDPHAPHVGWTYFRGNRRKALEKLWNRIRDS